MLTQTQSLYVVLILFLASYVNIWTREGKEKKNQMAFRFKCGNDYYFPKVDVTVDGSLTVNIKS